MGAQTSEMERGAGRKTSNVKMTGTPRVFKTETRILLHIRTWTTESMEKTLPYKNPALGLVKEIIGIM